jgi:hypothetical protein
VRCSEAVVWLPVCWVITMYTSCSLNVVLEADRCCNVCNVKSYRFILTSFDI